MAPDHAWAHVAMGVVQIYTSRAVQGIAECEHALALDPNLAEAHAVIGITKLVLGRFEETETHVQLHHAVTDMTGETGMRIIRAVVAGERDPAVLATHRDRRCHASEEEIAAALAGNWREEHVFALGQALELYDAYHASWSAICGSRGSCDANALAAYRCSSRR